MHHRKANFHLDPEFEAEFFAAAGLDLNDPETQTGAFISRHGIKAVGAAMMDNQISTDVAYAIAQLPTEQQQARLEAHLIRDAGKFKEEYEQDITARALASLRGEGPKVDPVGVKRGEIATPASVTIPLSIEDIVEIQRLRTEVGIATDADYIIEALRMMRLAISLGRIGYVVHARSSQSPEIVEFAVPLDRNDSVRAIKPYGDLSDG